MDGVAGSGKSTILKFLKEEFKKEGMVVADMSENPEEPAEFSNHSNADVIFSFEPTKSWVGAAIRKEMSFDGDYYDMKSQADAFAIDRQIQYRRLVIPALRSGVPVVQDRGITSSIVYQGMSQSPEMLDYVLSRSGNEIALEHAPTNIVLTKIDVKLLAERHANRDDESKGIYQDIGFLKSVQEKFHGAEFRNLFEKHGTKIHVLDTSLPLDKTLHNAKELFYRIMGLYE